MFRSGVSQGVLRSLHATAKPAATLSRTPLRQQLRSQLCSMSLRRPQPLHLRLAKPTTLSLVRRQTGAHGDRKPADELKAQRETELAKELLEAHPEYVSATSSTHPLMSEIGVLPQATKKVAAAEEEETEMLAGIKSDLKTIRDTFSLEGVPKEAYWVGMAGVLPYMVTSLSTVYCAYEIHHADETGTGVFLTGQAAEILLHIIEPLQIGYGAVIISFLGAIHWGLEWAGYGGHQGYPRYGIGVFATALAWPTLMLPIEYALITQFLVFNFLYYSDSQATKRGWAPPWYGVYRFVLTFIVGGSIVVTLIGRGQIADRIKRPHGVAERIRELREVQSGAREEEEASRRKYLSEKDEGEDEDEE